MNAFQKRTLAVLIRGHYALRRPVTNAEVDAELANLKRRGLANLDDSQMRLAATLQSVLPDLFKEATP